MASHDPSHATTGALHEALHEARQRRADAGAAVAPKALPPRKARTAAECRQLEQLPNIGPRMAADLRQLGVKHPQDLVGRDAFQLYRALCSASGKRQDPCVLDTFMAATDFMSGAAPRPWWEYTVQRKATFGAI